MLPHLLDAYTSWETGLFARLALVMRVHAPGVLVPFSTPALYRGLQEQVSFTVTLCKLSWVCLSSKREN